MNKGLITSFVFYGLLLFIGWAISSYSRHPIAKVFYVVLITIAILGLLCTMFEPQMQRNKVLKKISDFFNKLADVTSWIWLPF